jgi:hypothetical protein
MVPWYQVRTDIDVLYSGLQSTSSTLQSLEYSVLISIVRTPYMKDQY